MISTLSRKSEEVLFAESFPTFPKQPHICVRNSEMHPGKEAGALHSENRNEDVCDKDEEDDNGCPVVQAV